MPEVPLTGSETDAFSRRVKRSLPAGEKPKLKRAYAKRIRRKAAADARSELKD